MLQAGNPDIFLTIIHRTKELRPFAVGRTGVSRAKPTKPKNAGAPAEMRAGAGAARWHGGDHHAAQGNSYNGQAPSKFRPASKLQGYCPNVCVGANTAL
jgi:hypothetical protein